MNIYDIPFTVATWVMFFSTPMIYTYAYGECLIAFKNKWNQHLSAIPVCYN